MTIFPTNVAQILGNIMAYLKMLFLGKTDVMTIWATLGKIGLLFNLASGHTASGVLQSVVHLKPKKFNK